MTEQDYVCHDCRRPLIIDPKGQIVHAPPHCASFATKPESESLTLAVEMQAREAIEGKPTQRGAAP